MTCPCLIVLNVSLSDLSKALVLETFPMIPICDVAVSVLVTWTGLETALLNRASRACVFSEQLELHPQQSLLTFPFHYLVVV